MTVHINLLPYRKIRRAERQRRFNFMLIGSVVAAAGVVFLGLNYIDGKIAHQQERNKRLESAIAVLDKEIEEISDLKSRINDVLDRKRVVENLQSGRSRSVILLDEVARLLPEGIYVKSIKQAGDAISMEGVADTNARIAALVRNLGNSQWLESPELIQINAVTAGKVKQSAFTVRFKQKAQQAGKEGQ